MYTLTMKPNYRKISGLLYGACIEDVNHELYGGIWSQMIFGESFAEPAKEVGGCSGMWELTVKGSAQGSAPVVTEAVYTGSQAQRLELISGEGSIGVNNMGLNRSGMYFAPDKEYQGYIYAKADQPTQVYGVLEMGTVAYAMEKYPLRFMVAGRNIIFVLYLQEKNIMDVLRWRSGSRAGWNWDMSIWNPEKV